VPLTRLRQAGLLLPPVARTLRWAALPVVLVFAVGLVELERRQPGLDLWALRAAAVLLAVWAGLSLDDPAEATVEPTPFPPLGRRALRLLLALAALAACWALLVARTPGVPPVGGVTLEAAALVAVAVAAAAVAARLTADHRGGLAAGPAVLGLVLGAFRLPRRLALLAGPGDPGWVDAHRRWAAVLAVAVAVLLAASLPGRRRAGTGAAARRESSLSSPRPP
jgi:fluoroquinolone transport system permease protein